MFITLKSGVETKVKVKVSVGFIRTQLYSCGLYYYGCMSTITAVVDIHLLYVC